MPPVTCHDWCRCNEKHIGRIPVNEKSTFRAIRWDNTAPGTKFAYDFCAGIGQLQLGVVLVLLFFFSNGPKKDFCCELRMLLGSLLKFGFEFFLHLSRLYINAYYRSTCISPVSTLAYDHACCFDMAIIIGPILDGRLKEKILKPWKGALSSHSVCLSVCLCVCLCVCLSVCRLQVTPFGLGT